MDYKIRRGRRGRHDAISDADRYEGPICTGICTAGGAPGPGGAGRRLLPPTVLKYFIVNKTNYGTEYKHKTDFTPVASCCSGYKGSLHGPSQLCRTSIENFVHVQNLDKVVYHRNNHCCSPSDLTVQESSSHYSLFLQDFIGSSGSDINGEPEDQEYLMQIK